MISQKDPPLCRRWPRFRCFQCFDQRARIGSGQCIEEMLVDLEVEHHVHALPVFAEVIHVGFGQDVCFRQHNAVALAPLEEFAKHAQHIELLLWFSHLGPLVEMMKGTASIRNPETPAWIQKPMILSISACTSGFEVLRSGWKS